MKKSIFYFKQLNATEVGQTRTHEIYIRMPNDFDYKEFFQTNFDENTEGVVEKEFKAINLTKGHGSDQLVNLRFVYFKNSNKEKRIPSLGELFKKNDVKENDVVRLESRIVDKDVSYYITFLRPDEVQVNPKSFCYSILHTSGSDSNQDYTQQILHPHPFLLSALRTKPFMLLAGISGTGKSRLVREMAFMSCPKALRDQDQTQPGNFCMIEVKPNWHDSTELLGYWSNISRKYMFTSFVNFLVKAMMYPNVPFFVCLDEMNLAPVEQYLAELLSVLETRKLTADKRIRTGVLVDGKYFKELASVDGTHDANGNSFMYLKTDKDIYMKLLNLESLKGGENEEALAANTLCTSGLTLPDNVIIIGTVNMDDTTHKFSRKVIDRAMTIEMNGGELNSIFGGSSRLKYRADNEEVVGLDAFKAKYVSADDAINDCLSMSPFAKRITGGEEDDGTLAHRLKAINDCLEGTPFQVSYRVMNELVIYLAVLLDSEDGEVSDERFDELMSKAVDDILLMKILPRIEGDEQMFVTSRGNRLDSLLELTSPDSASHKKLLEMKERLEKSFFTRFWP